LLQARQRGPEVLRLLKDYSTDHADQMDVVAQLYEFSGLENEAQAAYRAFLTRKPQDPARINVYVRFLVRQGQDQEAFTVTRGALSELPPETSSSLSNLILTSGRKLAPHQRKLAESWIEEAHRRQPNSAQVQLEVAELRRVQGRYVQAEALYRRVLDAHPDRPDALNNLAWLLGLQSGRESEALEHVNKAIAISGPNPSFMDTRAVVHMKMGNLDAALDDLRKALASAPRKPALYVHLAQVQQKAGKAAAARDALKSAKELGWDLGSVDPRERASIDKLCRDLVSG
jgi:Tfp pilus assembly protein PilF